MRWIRMHKPLGLDWQTVYRLVIHECNILRLGLETQLDAEHVSEGSLVFQRNTKGLFVGAAVEGHRAIFGDTADVFGKCTNREEVEVGIGSVLVTTDFD